MAKLRTDRDVDTGNMMLLTGNSNPQLAQNIARHLQLPLGKASVGTFSDGEIAVEILENIRGREV